MLKQLLEFKQTDRKWHLPVLAGLCIGLPVLAGYYTNHLAEGKLVSLAALVILYIHSAGIASRMITLMACSFGIMVSFSVGVVFSFDPVVAAVVLGLFGIVVHGALYYLNMLRPPGNFFFIMVASIAICMPHNFAAAPQKIGLVGIGTMFSCVMGFVYSLLTVKNLPAATNVINIPKNKYVNFVESLTFGLFLCLSLLLAHFLRLENPYWAPTSCAAVMQGPSARHIWQRSVQRILGTLVGLGMTWVILLLQPSLLTICISIILLQTIVEFLVVRNYGIAVVFISVLTIFLAESPERLTAPPNALIVARFYGILIGSLLGAVGGWVLHNEHLRFLATRQIRLTKLALTKHK